MIEKELNNERDLFRRIAQGDGQAFTIIFNLYFERLRWNAFKMLKSEFWAEEMVQEVFTQLWANRENLADILVPSSYLFKVTAYRCFDRIRRQELEAKSQYIVNQVLHGSSDSVQQNKYDFNLIERLIHEAIQSLPPQGKIIYELQQSQDLSYREIAAKLKISPYTVRNHMIRNLQTIRDYLRKNGDFFLFLFTLYYFF